MTLDDIVRYRLVNQRLVGSTFTTPAQVVAWLGAVQAQEYSGGKWSIGLRLPGSTDADIDRAVADRSIIRTWPMRGTIHFVAAADIRWMVRLLAPRVISRTQSYFRKLKITDQVMDRARKILVKELTGKQLTRPEMYAALEDVGIATKEMRGLFILGRMAHEGLICFASHRGKQPTFALLDDWVVPAKSLSDDEALSELVRRYYTSHGPATVHDLAWWSGLTGKEIHKGLEMVGSVLTSEVVHGKTYWMSAKLPKLDTSYSDVYLLPTYDEFLISYKDRTASVEPLWSRQLVARAPGLFYSVVLKDGKGIGLWKRMLTKKGVTIQFKEFRPFTAKEKQARDAAAERYAAFLGLSTV